MLMIKDLADLKKYLETRRDMAKKQTTTASSVRKAEIFDANQKGMVFAFEESIKAVEALMETERLKVVPREDGGESGVS